MESGRKDSDVNYIPALDGLRAIAVLMVVAYHCRLPGVSGGFFGPGELPEDTYPYQRLLIERFWRR